jgi:hypothetical protein
LCGGFAAIALKQPECSYLFKHINDMKPLICGRFRQFFVFSRWPAFQAASGMDRSVRDPGITGQRLSDAASGGPETGFRCKT